MAGNELGFLKRKLGLKGATKPGEMISKMNSIKKSGSSKGKVKKIGYGK